MTNYLKSAFKLVKDNIFMIPKVLNPQEINIILVPLILKLYLFDI